MHGPESKGPTRKPLRPHVDRPLEIQAVAWWDASDDAVKLTCSAHAVVCDQAADGHAMTGAKLAHGNVFCVVLSIARYGNARGMIRYDSTVSSRHQHGYTVE